MANRLLTWKEVEHEMLKAYREAFLEIASLEMFIEGQYSWERPEFDEHG